MYFLKGLDGHHPIGIRPHATYSEWALLTLGGGDALQGYITIICSESDLLACLS